MVDRFATGTPLQAVHRPVHVCPTCLGITRQLDIHVCPECGVEMLERVPITGQVAYSAPARMSDLAGSGDADRRAA